MNTSQHNFGSGNLSEPQIPELDASRFELLEPIGSGGMGTVFRAVQRSVGRHVAVKVLAPEHAANATGLARFVREANIIARLTHPNIVQLIDFGRDRESRLLLVMELLEGEALRSLLRREGRLAPERAVYVAVQTLNALRVAHASGVVHRDLKPENIFIHRSGDDDHVKVLDFGVAKLTQGDVSDSNTTQGSLVGTLRYMAPEQVAGEVPDARIDVYAVGMVLFEMLSGTMPYDTRDRYVLLRQIIAEEPAHLLACAADISPPLADVVMRAIQKGARDRYQSADEFRRALTPFLSGDHARLQALSDATGRPTGPTAATSGEIRSGIVRSGHIPLTAGAVQSAPNTGLEPTLSASAARSSVERSSMPGHASSVGHAPAPSYPTGTGSPPVPSAPTSTRTMVPWMLLALVALLGAAVLVVSVLRRQTTTVVPTTTTATTPVAQQPVAPPEVRQIPSTRMVLVATNPAGAQVLDDQGQVLCPATPCAIPVPLGRATPVRIVREAITLNATLDPNTPNVTLDLSAITVPTLPREGATQRRASERRRNNNGGAANGNSSGDGAHSSRGEIPMFLPN